MNNQSELALVQWLEKELFLTQKELSDAQTTRFALEGIGSYEGAIKEDIDNRMNNIIFKYHWLAKQIDGIKLVF